MSKNWLAIYTKPRCEKKVSQRLAQQDVETYCPVRKSLRQWSDRKKMVSEPLFVSYVFVKVAEEERLKVLADPAVIQFVFWLGKPAIIRDEEINTIKIFLTEYPSAAVEEISYAPGDKVKVIRGPLKNIEGVATDIRGDRIILLLETMGHQLTAKIHKNSLLAI